MSACLKDEVNFARLLMIAPFLTRISIYPIKSLDGMTVDHSKLLKSGALEYDRRFAFFDEKGNFVNGKRNRKVHQLRASFDLNRAIVSLKIQGSDQSFMFHLDEEKTALENWLSNYFGLTIKLLENSVTGFPDDTNSPGPTIISTATLQAIASWFPDLSVDNLRLRFRANLEIDGVPPFWEDQLFTEADQSVQFQVGEVTFAGINPCQRCIVPTRDAMTGEAFPDFQKIFISKRKESLPSWTTRSRFNHFYRLSVNTRVPESETGKAMQIGDQLLVISH